MMKLYNYKFYLLAATLFGMISCNPIETTAPVKTDIVDAVFATGNIVTDQEYQVTAIAEGYLLKSMVEEGTDVTAGLSLFRLSNTIQTEQLTNARVNFENSRQKLDENAPEKIQLKLQLEQLESQLVLDKKNADRYQKLIKTNAVSRIEYDQVVQQYENSLRNVEIQKKTIEDLNNSLKLNYQNSESQVIIQQQQLNDYFLYSAIDGQVLQIFKTPGELVRRGEQVATIGGGKKIMKLFVAEEDIKMISVGQKVLVSLNTDSDKTYPGRVSKIFPSFDEKEHSFIVEADFVQQPKVFYHNSQLQANIIVAEKAGTMVVPREFIIEGDSVLLSSGETRFVKTGIKNDQWVEIINGLDATVSIQKPHRL